MHSSSGSVLLMALITCTILYLVAATLLLLTMTEVQISDFESRSTQAFYAAESSVTLGLSHLRQEHNYRTTSSDTMMLGGNPALLSVSFEPQIFDNTTSLYHLTLRGTGAVSGPQTSTVRHIEQNIVIKPFALLANNTVTIGDNCRIMGNVHGNGPVTLGAKSRVNGNVSSSELIATTDVAVEVVDLVSDGRVSEHEPALLVPVLDFSQYYPTYWFHGEQGTAQPLTSDKVTLMAVGPDEPPAPEIIVYSGMPTSENPARIFYPTEPLQGPLTAIDLDGTLVIPSDYKDSSLLMTGPVRITPVENLPAIISARDIKLTLMNGEGLKKYAKSLKKTHITGLIYSCCDVLLRGPDLTGQIITGSVVGSTITLTTTTETIMFQVTYDPTLLSSSPPGIDFLEPGEWREPFSP